MYNYDDNSLAAHLFRIKESNGNPAVIAKEWNEIKKKPREIFLLMERAINDLYDCGENGARWFAMLLSHVFKTEISDEEFKKGIMKDVAASGEPEKKLEMFRDGILMALVARVMDGSANLDTKKFYGIVARELVYATEDCKHSLRIKAWFSDLIGNLIRPAAYTDNHRVAYAILMDVDSTFVSKRVLQLLAKKCNSPEPGISEGAKNALAALIANTPEKEKKGRVWAAICKALENESEEKRKQTKREISERSVKLKRIF